MQSNMIPGTKEHYMHASNGYIGYMYSLRQVYIKLRFFRLGIFRVVQVTGVFVICCAGNEDASTRAAFLCHT